MSFTWWNYLRCGIGLNLRGLAHGHRVARAAEVPCDQLGGLVGRVTGPDPSGVIHVVGLGRTEYAEAAQLFQGLNMLLRRQGNAILCERFADRAVLAFDRSAVVAPDVEDQRIVAVAELLDFIRDAAALRIHVLGESGKHLDPPPLEGLLVLPNRIPRGQRRGVGRESRIRRNRAHLSGACPKALTA
jgi:hypothetical protein